MNCFSLLFILFEFPVLRFDVSFSAPSLPPSPRPFSLNSLEVPNKTELIICQPYLALTFS